MLSAIVFIIKLSHSLGDLFKQWQGCCQVNLVLRGILKSKIMLFFIHSILSKVKLMTSSRIGIYILQIFRMFFNIFQNPILDIRIKIIGKGITDLTCTKENTFGN